ncbi:MAG: hypothetical protein IPG17_09940 [Sandaracinaceae bacterium]|nr:hypothetical protein [Sandaracinaceae bacterium]MBP7681888.1 hypothetical protein [Deltaproteobacteria bacterium]MBK6810859.1 hypothetical protein [Sandaracinaceae bacterium]MBK7154566.1 hypothetical protein [Sandaracinaceae bacterium]MBK7775537.1 hypothetical protein [Sandaracinaceae bacterium]
MSLQVHILRARAPQVDLADFIPRGEAELLYQDQRGELSLAASRCTPGPTAGGFRRTVVRYIEDAGAWRALDETVFEIDAESFAEVVQITAAGGPNLHLAPICLPRRLTVGEWHRPLPGVPARVTLASHALVRIESTHRAARTEVSAIGMLATQGGKRGLQWLALGVGELCIGPARGAPERWLIAARVDGASFLHAIEPSLLERERRPLGALSDIAPRSSVF